MRRHLATIKHLWRGRREFLFAMRPVLVAYAWHAAFVTVLTFVVGDFTTAALGWLVFCNAGRDAALGYGFINQRQF
ncbi:MULTISPECIES: hypothetical protein [unclassified Mesorhizobium]|uniref:hypothetical protein n=1 Tax=unclassified Mesorhizobium TaxID=325217 RepID=UPI00109414AE|nr:MULTISPECIES: hypothetical protein [unclassified Mesorhizobium]TGT90890.1 hypothetical protein EN804_06015 [Mesorhizobium sp. M8A.F.Ca.ET.161.01.1.1]TGV43830.1 hypothetical protein EN785_07530 [Mesorhizobium sp. M8A.F.Ca.ET.142.01.1.1]